MELFIMSLIFIANIVCGFMFKPVDYLGLFCIIIGTMGLTIIGLMIFIKYKLRSLK